MKERPILFSGPMVKAILEGRKTQTRRVLKSPDPCCYDPRPFPKQYEVGMRLWVRETHQFFEGCDGRGVHYPADDKSLRILYDGDQDDCKFLGVGDELKGIDSFIDAEEYPKRPSIFMPRWASRIMLEVTNVRIERIQEISHDDVLCEGTPLEGQFAPRRQSLTVPQIVFSHRWDALNGKRGFGWDKNPWVWVVEFKRVEAARG